MSDKNESIYILYVLTILKYYKLKSSVVMLNKNILHLINCQYFLTTK